MDTGDSPFTTQHKMVVPVWRTKSINQRTVFSESISSAWDQSILTVDCKRSIGLDWGIDTF